ncbi:MAG: class I SAM-dependent methyltransferase [Terracidiphilus sp.]
MKLNFAEQLLVNNRVRTAVQTFYEGPLLRRLGGMVRGGTVLEIGCGRGAGIEVILRQFDAAHVCGIDLDPLQIERARRRLQSKYSGRFTLVQGDAERLPFADRSFDAVFDFGALHHLVDWQRGIAEILRVLKPGGTLFFEEVMRSALERWIYRRFLDHPSENRFSEAEFMAEIENHGLRPTVAPRRILFGDIFIGTAKLPQPWQSCHNHRESCVDALSRFAPDDSGFWERGELVMLAVSIHAIGVHPASPLTSA